MTTTTTLWLLYHNPDDALATEIASALPLAQQQRARQFKGKRRQEFVLSRLLLTHALADNNHWTITEQPKRPPIVTIESEQQLLSVSHSHGWIGVIMANHAEQQILGLDIEKIRPRLRRATAEYFCNSKQLAQLEAFEQADKQRYLTRLWTQKEAYFKAHHQPILNAKTKALSFDNNSNSDGYIYSAALGDNFELSVFSDVPIKLKPRFACVDTTGQIANTTPTDLRWISDYND